MNTFFFLYWSDFLRAFEASKYLSLLASLVLFLSASILTWVSIESHHLLFDNLRRTCRSIVLITLHELIPSYLFVWKLSQDFSADEQSDLLIDLERGQAFPPQNPNPSPVLCFSWLPFLWSPLSLPRERESVWSSNLCQTNLAPPAIPTLKYIPEYYPTFWVQKYFTVSIRISLITRLLNRCFKNCKTTIYCINV